MERKIFNIGVFKDWRTLHALPEIAKVIAVGIPVTAATPRKRAMPVALRGTG